jgi:hypothetical protein
MQAFCPSYLKIDDCFTVRRDQNDIDGDRELNAIASTQIQACDCTSMGNVETIGLTTYSKFVTSSRFKTKSQARS